MATFTEVIAPPRAQFPERSARVFADAVLHELDERYDRGPWQERRRRRLIIVAAIALAGVAAAAIKALSIAHHRR